MKLSTTLNTVDNFEVRIESNTEFDCVYVIIDKELIKSEEDRTLELCRSELKELLENGELLTLNKLNVSVHLSSDSFNTYNKNEIDLIFEGSLLTFSIEDDIKFTFDKSRFIQNILPILKATSINNIIKGD